MGALLGLSPPPPALGHLPDDVFAKPLPLSTSWQIKVPLRAKELAFGGGVGGGPLGSTPQTLAVERN